MSEKAAGTVSQAVAASHTLAGLEPDNLQAFLASLGLLRALELRDPSLQPRLRWHPEGFVPELHLARPLTTNKLLDQVNEGIVHAAQIHEFDRQNIKFTREEFRTWAESVAHDSRRGSLVAALASDGILKRNSDEVAATPLCAMFGQAHQHFLTRLSDVPRDDDNYESELYEALFEPWRYGGDSTKSFRWDPIEDRRHAYQFGDPSLSKNQIGTQPGAARLAAVGFVVLSSVPTLRELRTLGLSSRGRETYVCWPLTGVAVGLAGLIALLAHPALGDAQEAPMLKAYGVTAVCRSRRYQSGKFFNFERAVLQIL